MSCAARTTLISLLVAVVLPAAAPAARAAASRAPAPAAAAPQRPPAAVAPPAVAAAPEPGPLAGGGWLRGVLRGLLLAAALPFAAALALPVLLRGWPVPPGLAGGAAVEAARRRVGRLAADLGWTGVGLAALLALAEAADAGGSVSPAALAEYVREGTAGPARLAAVLLLAAAAGAARARRAALAAAGAVAALGALAIADQAEPGAAGALAGWAHLAAAAVLVGGIVVILVAWGGVLRRGEDALRAELGRLVLAPWGAAALAALALGTASGLLALSARADALPGRWQASYLALLAIKVAAAAAAATLLARRIARPPAAAPLRAAAALGLAAVAVGALLGAYPPAPAPAAPGCGPCPLPAAAPAELAVAAPAGSDLVAAWMRRSRRGLTGVVRVRDRRGAPSAAAIRLPGVSGEPCGPGCRRFAAPAATEALRVEVTSGGRRRIVRLPARWRPRAAARARRLLGAAQTAMRRIRSVREIERITSGPGTSARTDYALRAPDRLAFRTDRGVRAVVDGPRQWLRVGRGPWAETPYGAGLPFRTRRWFRWTPYAGAVRLLAVRDAGPRRLAELALYDPGTPVWFRLTVDLATRRVLRERMTATGHFMTARYFAFDRPLPIEIPRSRER